MQMPGYTIAQALAEGGMSKVYLAVQDSLGRPVALKLLKKFDHPEHAERFLNEARTIAALQHRNIITIYDVGRVGERYYIAMEYLEGGSLLDRIARGMSADEAVELLERIAACLDFVHRRDVIHRDLKPSNILFHADGTPKLTDFGIAKQLDADQERTMDGSAFGSPYYLSPEQAEGQPLDGRCDIYALGVVFYQMLTGRLPYAENSHIETIIAHLSEPIPVLPQHLSAYQGLLERMLAKQPGERIASAAELLREIRLLRQRCGDAGPAATRDRPAASLLRRAVHRLREAPLAIKLTSAAGVLIVVGSILLSADSPERGTLRLQVAAPAAAGSAPQDADAGGAKRDDADGPSAWPTAASATLAPTPAAEAQVPELPPAEPAAAQANTLDHREPFKAVGAAAAEPAAPARLDGSRAASAEADAPQDVVAAKSPHAAPADTVQQVPQEPATPSGPAAAEPLVDGTAAIIAAHMQAGDEALRRLRLTTPPGDNAYTHYRKVLEQDPQHAGARAGIDRIADRYATLTDRALDAGDLRLAEVYLDRGLDIAEDHAQLRALRRDLEAAAAPVAQPQLAAQPRPKPKRPDPADDSQRQGTGNFVQDMKSVWRSIFN